MFLSGFLCAELNLIGIIRSPDDCRIFQDRTHNRAIQQLQAVDGFKLLGQEKKETKPICFGLNIDNIWSLNVNLESKNTPRILTVDSRFDFTPFKAQTK